MLRTITIAVPILSLLMIGATMSQAQPQPGPPPPANSPPASQQEAADAIQRAYDGLGRSAVIGQNAPRDIDELLMRGREAYQQALSLYQASDFTGARETAMASADIARAAEQLVTVGFSAPASKPPLPPPPGEPGRADMQAARAYQDLARVRDHASRLSNDLTTSASAPVAAQVRALMSESHQLERRAQALLAADKLDQASTLARAADALLAASDHFVRRAWIANGLAPPPPEPAPPPPKGPAPGAPRRPGPKPPPP